MVTAFDVRQVTNGAKEVIDLSLPYQVHVQVQGVAPILFHAWNNEAVEEKSKAAKNSKAKKSDNLEAYVYRTDDGALGIPGKMLTAALAEAGRYMQDPRSPRKSARDLCRAGLVSLTTCAPLEPRVVTWDYEDRQRVTVQRNSITRTRPAMRTGWKASFDLLVATPEYLPPEVVQQLLANAGRLCGLADFRPSYGRFSVTHFELVNA